MTQALEGTQLFSKKYFHTTRCTTLVGILYTHLKIADRNCSCSLSILNVRTRWLELDLITSVTLGECLVESRYSISHGTRARTRPGYNNSVPYTWMQLDLVTIICSLIESQSVTIPWGCSSLDLRQVLFLQSRCRRHRHVIISSELQDQRWGIEPKTLKKLENVTSNAWISLKVGVYAADHRETCSTMAAKQW